MSDGECGVRLGGSPVARVDVGAVILCMPGDGTSMQRELLPALMFPMITSEHVHVQ